jgi:hypothetical protein
VYAIVGRDTPLPSDDAAGLTMIPCRELAAVTGRIADDGATPTMDAVLRHEAVVEAVRQLGRSLPVRFGTVFRDPKSLVSAIAERYDQLVADLDRLGDKVELSVTALWATPPTVEVRVAFPDDANRPATQRAGIRYMHDRAEQFRRDDALTTRARVVALRLDDFLGGHAIDRRVSLLPTPRVAFRTAYLLDSVGVDAFRSAFDAMRREPREVQLLLTGPWPPYNFVRRTHTRLDN